MFLKLIKSKTIDFNIIVAAIVGVSESIGFAIPVEVVTGFFAIGNFVLRLLTKKPIAEK